MFGVTGVWRGSFLVAGTRRPGLRIYPLGVYKAFMNMRESSYFILAALMDDRLHGYAIVKRAEELSGGRVRLAAGTLYATLERLVTQEYVVADGEAVVNGRARRYYSLTEAGSAVLREQAMRMAAAAKVVTDRPTGTLRSARVSGESA